MVFNLRKEELCKKITDGLIEEGVVSEKSDQQVFVSSEREQKEGELQQSEHEATGDKTSRVRELELTISWTSEM